MFCFHGNGQQQTSKITFFCDAEVIIHLLALNKLIKAERKKNNPIWHCVWP